MDFPNSPSLNQTYSLDGKTWTWNGYAWNTEGIAYNLTNSNITTALGYTPYNSTNPNGYTSNAGTVTSVTAGTGLSGGAITGSGTISLSNTGVTAGSYTSANITVDAQGRVTAAGSGGGGSTSGILVFVGGMADGGSYATTAAWTWQKIPLTGTVYSATNASWDNTTKEVTLQSGRYLIIAHANIAAGAALQMDAAFSFAATRANRTTNYDTVYFSNVDVINPAFSSSRVYSLSLNGPSGALAIDPRLFIIKV